MLPHQFSNLRVQAVHTTGNRTFLKISTPESVFEQLRFEVAVFIEGMSTLGQTGKMPVLK